MRCIETNRVWSFEQLIPKINYNMRCIETDVNFRKKWAVTDKLQHEMY